MLTMDFIGRCAACKKEDVQVKTFPCTWKDGRKTESPLCEECVKKMIIRDAPALIEMDREEGYSTEFVVRDGRLVAIHRDRIH